MPTNPMQHYLKIVGNGRRTARDLSTEEAEAAIEMVLSGQASMAQTAALMAALRIKEESADELAAFAGVLSRHTQQLAQSDPSRVDICVPYDGRTKTAMLLPAAAVIAAAGGAQIGLHGRLGPVTPPKFGLGVGDVFQALGFPVKLSLKDAGALLSEVGLAFACLENFAPCLVRFDQIREEYGMRSFFNTLEKLANPFHAPTALVGVFHQPVMERVASAAKGRGYRRGLIVQGPEGSVDVYTSRRTPILEFAAGGAGFHEWAVDPLQFGGWEHFEGGGGSDAGAAADFTRSLLDPAIPSPHRKSALLTAALILYAAGKAEEFHGAFTHAKQIVDRGQAWQHLKLLGEKHAAIA